MAKGLMQDVTWRSATDPSAVEERLPAQTVLWAAGVAASPLATSLGVPLDRAGRVTPESTLAVPGTWKNLVPTSVGGLVNVPAATRLPSVTSLVPIAAVTSSWIAWKPRMRDGLRFS